MSNRMYTCGVPTEHCNGTHVKTSAGIRPIFEYQAARKAHGSSSEAFRCRARWLTQVLGYTQIGSREFRPPEGVDDGYVTVLAKKSRFGGVLRRGKGSAGADGIARVMPYDRLGGSIARF